MRQLPGDLYPQGPPEKAWAEFYKEQTSRGHSLIAQHIWDRWDVIEWYCAAGRRGTRVGEAPAHNVTAYMQGGCGTCGAPLHPGGLAGWGKHRAYAAWFAGMMEPEELGAFESQFLRAEDLQEYVLLPMVRQLASAMIVEQGKWEDRFAGLQAQIDNLVAMLAGTEPGK